MSRFGRMPAPGRLANLTPVRPAGVKATPARGLALFCIGCLGLVAEAPTALAQEARPFNVHDLWEMERISDPQVSPDGQWVVFGLSRLDAEADRRRSDLWMVGTDGSGLRQLTAHPSGEFNARWAPDGSAVYFLASRTGSVQVWRIGMTGGEAVQVTDLPLGVGSMAISPDGTLLAVSMEVFPDCPDLQCTLDRLAREEARQSSGILYERLFIRHWDTWKDGRRSHLFVVPADGAGVAASPRPDNAAGSPPAPTPAAPVNLMQGMDADCPSKPFGGPGEYTFTPDSRGVVFTARVAGREEPWSTNFDLFLSPVDGSAEPRLLTADNPAWDTQPLFSPDGRTLAYLAMERPGFESDRLRIVLKSWPQDPFSVDGAGSPDVANSPDGANSTDGANSPDSTTRVLTQDWDRSVGSMAFSPDGRTLLVTAQNLGNTSLFAVDVASGDVRELIREGTVRYPSFAGDGIVFGMDHFRSPVELYTGRTDGTGIRPITAVNAQRLARVKFGEPEQMTFRGADDAQIYAWLLKPVDFDPSKRYPVAFIVHGGPQGSSSSNFHYRWNPQIYAAAGYATLLVDFHGSTGYGQDFTDAITGDWGGKPLEDLKKGMAAALERYPWMDGDRACALGASYGGYMMNWIAGNWPDGFRCLVNHNGILDQRMMYFATEELWFMEWEHGGTYWDNPAGFELHNPALHVDRWQTPMLVVHGALDYRVPLEQGIGTFTALQRRGIPSQFLYFPDENHWVLSPANGILWHETILAWLEQWTRE